MLCALIRCFLGDKSTAEFQCFLSKRKQIYAMAYLPFPNSFRLIASLIILHNLKNLITTVRWETCFVAPVFSSWKHVMNVMKKWIIKKLSIVVKQEPHKKWKTGHFKWLFSYLGLYKRTILKYNFKKIQINHTNKVVGVSWNVMGNQCAWNSDRLSMQYSLTNIS